MLVQHILRSGHVWVRFVVALGLFLSMFSNGSPGAQAQTPGDEPTPTLTPTAEPAAETPAPQATEQLEPFPDSTDITPPPSDGEVGSVSVPDLTQPTQAEPQAFAALAAASPASEGTVIANESYVEQRPALAYNATNQQYLVVWMDWGPQEQIRGRLLDGNGIPIGAAFTVAVRSAGGVYAPKLAYSASTNSYLVIWGEPNGLVSVESYCLGNCVTYTLNRFNLYALPLAADGTPLAASPILLSNQVTPFGFTETAWDVVYNSGQAEFLVNWIQPRGAFVYAGGNLYIAQPNRVLAQRLGADGGLRGAAVVLKIGAVSSYQMAYSALSNEYFMLWNVYPNHNVEYEIYYQRFRADTLALKGNQINLSGFSLKRQDFASVGYDSQLDRYLVTWWDPAVSPARVRSRMVQGGTGALVGTVKQVSDSADPAHSFYAFIANSPVEQQYLVVMGTSNGLKGRNISSDGQVLGNEPFTIASDSMPGGIVARAGGDANAPRYVAVWEKSWDIFGKGLPEVPSVSPVTLTITDSAGNPVNALALNSDGWPVLNAADGVTVANPLMVKVTLDHYSILARQVTLDLFDTNNKSRFYVSGSANDADEHKVHCQPENERFVLHQESNSHSYQSYSQECNFNLTDADLQTLQWQVWIQPSEPTNLTFRATFSSLETEPASAQSTVAIPQASIFPIVFIPGLGATNPPEFNPDYHDTDKTDWLLKAGSAVGYDNMYHALEKLGYECNRTYFLFPYDWLLATPYVAQRLRDELLLPAAIEISTSVPWVVGYGSPEGQDVKFDLIGHSTGNLVARSYIQGNEVLWAGHVRRFVSLAGPHKGLPKGFTLFEGAAEEGTCNIADQANFDIACLAFWYARSRAEAAQYGTKLCLPWPFNNVCVWDWDAEDKYLFIHDPLYDPRAPSSVTGFLPTYTEASYLTNSSGDFPYGRLANPLFDTASILGSALGGGTIDDPYTDNDYAMANLQQRYPDQMADYSTTYYGLNSTDKMQLLFDRIGDPATNSNNVCLIYGKGTGLEEPTDNKNDVSDTRVRIIVSESHEVAPYWLTGARANAVDDRWGLGDQFVPGVSGGATDIWKGTLLGKYDLDQELQGPNPNNPINWAAHGTLVGYGLTHQHIAECLIGTVPGFLSQTPSGEKPPIAGKVSQGVLAAPVRTQGADTSLFSHALLVSVRGPVELTLTDAQGRRLGYNPASIQPWAEIPEGLYTYDADLDFKYLLIWSPAIEDYTLTITGTGPGDYTVLGSYYDSSGEVNLFYTQAPIVSGATDSVNVTVPAQAVDVPQPPDINAGPDVTANEGEPISFRGKVADINPGDTHTYQWDFGDGSAPVEGSLTPTHLFGDNGEYLVTLTVTDSAGFEVQNTLKVAVQNVPPMVEAGNDRTGNAAQPLTFAGSLTDPGFLDTHTLEWDFGDGTGASGTLTPTHSYTGIGTYIVKLTIRDDDRGVDSDTLIVTIQYAFSGFFSPVDNLPTLNTVNAGQAIPVKFNLGGNYGLNIFAVGYPSSSVVACGATAEDAVEETVAAGSSSLSYSAGNNQYTYVWKTDKAWVGTCRTLVVKLTDGTYHKANFKFK